MEIILTNVEEAGMPPEMAGHCKTLVERRIRKEFDGNPPVGADVTILYSDKDPLGQSKEVDDAAYFIYFTVESVEPGAGNGSDAPTIQLSLVM